MADVREQTERPPQTEQYRLTGPYGRMVQDAETKAWSTVDYETGAMMTPTWAELEAHPDRFEKWPPAGTVLAEPKAPDAPPPDDEPHAARSRR